jgi:uncharacterized protein
MRWRTGRRSENVVDRRGAGPRFGGMRFPTQMRLPGGGFPGGGRGRRAGGIGIVGIALLLLAALFFGVDPRLLLDQGTTSYNVPPYGTPADGTRTTAEEEELADFVSAVLADTEDTWHGLFARMDLQYEEPMLVLFSDAVESDCGFAQAAAGPFYCPLDRSVFIDLGFYEELRSRFRAPGDFAQAYVIAHEVGHHVQNLLGILPRVHEARQQVGQAEANELSVRLELQADCFAGVWAHHAQAARNILEEGDIEEGLNAASAVGDDQIQRRSQGYAVPESFTHGTAEQRASWFVRGLETGELEACETFGTDSL